MRNTIWIFAETEGDRVCEITLEVLSEAARLAATCDWAVGAVLMGQGVTAAAADLSAHGADRVYIADHAALAVYTPEVYTTVLSGLIDRERPSVFLFGCGARVADLAPRVAARLRTGLLTGVDRLQILDDGTLQATRLCYERKVHTTVACSTARPQMATVEPGVMRISKRPRPEGTSVHVDIDADLADARQRIRVLRFIKADPQKMDIVDAPLIVAGGRGAGEGDQFGVVEQLADLMGAAVAGSRVAVDNGCIDRRRQIGQSGKTVSPDLIISCGISGANAHTIGMRGAKTIVAINTDKNAPMIKLADLGVVGDLNEILPALNRLIADHNTNAKRSTDRE